MLKNWRLPLVLGLPLFCAIPLATPATAEKTCPWLKQVLADRENDFATFKGGVDEFEVGKVAPTLFNGTLGLNVTGKAKEEGCKLSVRSYADQTKESENPPKYYCKVASDVTFEQGAADYELIAGKLRDCLPGLVFDDSRKGDPVKQTEYWKLSAATGGALIELYLFDRLALAETLQGKPLSGKPGVSVGLYVSNTLPLRPGSGIEIPVIQ